MHNLTDKLFTKVVSLSRTPSTVAQVADNLLSRLVPQEDVSAQVCQTLACSGCLWGRKLCTKVCCSFNIDEGISLPFCGPPILQRRPC